MSSSCIFIWRKKKLFKFTLSNHNVSKKNSLSAIVYLVNEFTVLVRKHTTIFHKQNTIKLFGGVEKWWKNSILLEFYNDFWKLLCRISATEYSFISRYVIGEKFKKKPKKGLADIDHKFAYGMYTGNEFFYIFIQFLMTIYCWVLSQIIFSLMDCASRRKRFREESACSNTIFWSISNWQRLQSKHFFLLPNWNKKRLFVWERLCLSCSRRFFFFILSDKKLYCR